MMDKCFALYRYSHSDGTAKEWAIYVGSDTQEIEVRFGKAGQLSQQRLIRLILTLKQTDESMRKSTRVIDWLDKSALIIKGGHLNSQMR